MRLVAWLAGAVLPMIMAVSAAGQEAVHPLPGPPTGFAPVEASASVKAMRSAGVADRVEAQKENAGWPGCMTDPKVTLSYGWTALPGADQSLRIMAQTPEEPASFAMGTKTEPAGKKEHKSGVLTWRKKTVTVAGSSSTKCPGNQVVMHDGSWAGYVDGKLLAVGVSNLYGPKDVGQALIDEYIDKVVAAVK